MEAPVEAINKRTEVTGFVFGEIECMISVTQASFEVAKNRNKRPCGKTTGNRKLIQLNSGKSLGLRSSATIAEC